jgi:hypothetical protein
MMATTPDFSVAAKHVLITGGAVSNIQKAGDQRRQQWTPA